MYMDGFTILLSKETYHFRNNVVFSNIENLKLLRIILVPKVLIYFKILLSLLSEHSVFLDVCR